MFEATYRVQPARGSVLYSVGVICEVLNESDDLLDFDLQTSIADWLSSDKSESYKHTPHSLVLGIWLYLTERCNRAVTLNRGVVISFVEIEAPTYKTKFRLPNANEKAKMNL